jgi:hypothetical protein
MAPNDSACYQTILADMRTNIKKNHAEGEEITQELHISRVMNPCLYDFEPK